MPAWTGVVLALAEPADDRMGSSLPTCLHPLAGRSLAWHALHALAGTRPAPGRLAVVSDVEIPREPLLELDGGLCFAGPGSDPLRVLSGRPDDERVLLVDARAPLLQPALERLLAMPPGGRLVDGSGRLAAVCLDPDRAGEVLRGGGLSSVTAEMGEALVDADCGQVVRSRRAFSDAARSLRDRIVSRLMDGGVTFLLPETAWVDQDVQIGRDAVIYPGVVLEGATTIGEETVIGPHCRIVDSWVGSGVEMKGWNYLSHTSIRNRAILEPYVRRGFE